MGARQARRYFMTAEVIDAPRAGQLGLVHEVVPAVDLDTTVERLVSALLAGAPVPSAVPGNWCTAPTTAPWSRPWWTTPPT